MSHIKYIDTDGNKSRLLPFRYFGLDNYTSGNDVGRVYIGTGTENIPLAKKSEVTALADEVALMAVGTVDAGLLGGQEGAYYLDASNINAGTIDDARLPDTITSSITGNAGTATKLATARTINGVAFDGTANIVAPTNLGITAGTTTGPTVTSSSGTNATLPTASATASGVVTTSSQTFAGVKTFSSTISGSINGNSASATKLQTAKTIGGVAFDGSTNINLPGVNTAGNQNTSGNAATATKLQTAKTINGVAFDGSTNITVVDNTKVALTGNETIGGVKTFSSTVVGNISGNAGTATKLQTARTINGVAFDGSTNITVVDNTKVALTGNETIAGTKTFSSNIVGSITGNSATATALANARTINGVSFNGTSNITVEDSTKLTKANPAITGSITEQVYNLTGTEINPENGTIQYKSVSSNTTFTERLTSGQSVLLRLSGANGRTITFPTIKWVGADAPELTANCAIVLWKEQSTLYGAFVGTLV